MLWSRQQSPLCRDCLKSSGLENGDHTVETGEVKPESTLLGSECDQVNHPPHQVQSLPLLLLISAGVTHCWGDQHRDGDRRVADEPQAAS